MFHIAGKGHTHFAAEKRAEIFFAEACFRCHFIERQIGFIVVAVDIINGPGYLVREIELIVELYVAFHVAEKIYGPYTHFLAGP